MSEEVYTVEFAAERLRLHPKTVLRFIAEGRLRATKVGKSYRILRSDLDALLGSKAKPGPPVAEARVTSVVEIPDASEDMARRLSTVVPAALKGREPGGPPMRADVIYEPDRSHLKIILVGAPRDTAAMLSLIQVMLEA